MPLTNVPLGSNNPSLYSTSRPNDVDGITASLNLLNLTYSSRTNSGASARPVSELRRVVTQNEIDGYVQQTINEARPSETELAAKRQICIHLQSIVCRAVPNGTLKIIGGVGNNFALKGSDIDMCIDASPSMDLTSSQLENLTMAFRRAGVPKQCYHLDTG